MAASLAAGAPPPTHRHNQWSRSPAHPPTCTGAIHGLHQIVGVGKVGVGVAAAKVRERDAVADGGGVCAQLAARQQSKAMVGQ